MPWETAAPARRLLVDMRGGVRFGSAGGEAAKGHVKGCVRSLEGPELEPTLQQYSTAQLCSAIQQRRPTTLCQEQGDVERAAKRSATAHVPQHGGLADLEGVAAPCLAVFNL